MSVHDFHAIHKPLSEPQEVPHSIEAEQALLGAILIKNDTLDRIGPIEPFDFYDPLHAQIFETISSLVHAGRLASPITLKPYFEAAAPIGDLTVSMYLARLVGHTPTLLNAPHYARTIMDLSARRKMIGVAQDMLAMAYDSPVDMTADSVIERAERGLYDIAERSAPGREVTFEAAISQAMSSVSKAYQADGRISGVPTGLADLDYKLGGLQNSDLIILGGRPSMGKSALAMTIAHNVAKSTPAEKDPSPFVHVFSLEMGAAQLALRQISAEAEIASEKLRRGMISEGEFRSLMEHARTMSKLPMLIDETGGIGIGSLAAKARRIKRRHGTTLLVVDYLQLMTSQGRRGGENRVQEITEITTGLKALAKDLDVPILALSQLSRKVEERADKRPQLADLRESGSIEQDADVVMFVYRDEYYLEREKPDESDLAKYADWDTRNRRAEGRAEVIIGKHRHGPVGIVEVTFESQFTRFGNVYRGQSNGH